MIPTHFDRPVAVVADAHLGGAGGAATDLARELDALDPESCGLVLFLGDLLHVWIGRRRFETPEIREISPSIAGLRSRGIASVYIEGNRDFFIAEGDWAGLFDVVADEHSFTVGDTRYLAVHGDGLNNRDWRYRIWRRVAKNPLSRAVIARFPRTQVSAFMHRGERRLARTNFRHRRELPEAAIRRYAEKRLSQGHDVVVLGHFHEPRRFTVAGGEARVFDAWFNRRSLEWIEPA